MLHVLKFGSAPFNIMIEPSETKVLLIYEECIRRRQTRIFISDVFH